MLNHCQNYVGTSEYTHWGLEYWESVLSANTEKTVDELAKEANDSARIGFQVLTAKVLVECEKTDIEVHNEDWIELFMAHTMDLCDRTGAQNVLPNLGFINLNYDRSFVYRYSSFVGNIWNSFPGVWERDGVFPGYGTDFRHHIHPHGIVGGYSWSPESERYCTITSSTFANFTNMRELEYGDIDELEKMINANELGVMPVDVVGPSTWHGRNQIAYVRANNLLGQAKNVVIIGLSQSGWTQSHLSIGSNVTAWSTGYDPIGKNVSCLNCYALPLMDSVGSFTDNDGL